MARFDVYEYDSASVTLVLDVQADLLSDLATCVVVPLVPEVMARQEVLPRLKPTIEIAGTTYILMTTDIGALPRNSLGKRVCNIEATDRDTVVAAVDFLLQGF